MRDWTEYLGIPYIPGGRDLKGLDCYGLFLLVEREVYGREFRDYHYENISPKEQARLIKAGAADLKGRATKTPSPGAAAVLPGGWHIGIYIGEGLILHTTKETGSIISLPEREERVKYYDFDTFIS